MEHILQVHTTGNHPRLPIDANRFESLKTSKQILSEALAIEEEYEIIISNYLDLEKESANSALVHMVRDDLSYIDFFYTRLALDRHLMSLLTSISLYTDTLVSHCHICMSNDADVKANVNKFMSTEYDENFDYRFMEALRNHIQHFGTAVYSVSHGGRWTSLSDEGLLEYSSTFTTNKKHLSKNIKFKKQVLKEMPDIVDLIVSSRGYLESISKIHDSIRKMISIKVNEARAIIQQAIADYKTIYQKDPFGLTACVFQDETTIEEIPIFLNWDDMRLELEKRNGNLVNLRKRYIIGRVKKN